MTALALSPLATLSRRRFQLTTRTPRELLVPLLTPIMFALVIAPSLKTALHTQASYESYVAIGTIGLLIPLNTMFAGLGVIVDREGGAQRELLAAPVPRALIVLGNLLVALAITGLQVGVLFTGAILTETIFSWPGVGKWLIEGINRRDYPVLQGGTLLIGAIVMIVNLLVDVAYGLINPRIRYTR